MGDDQAPGRARFLRHVHHGPVGETGHGQARHPLQRVLVVHQPRQCGAGVGQKAGRPLGDLAIRDVVEGDHGGHNLLADPNRTGIHADNHARFITQHQLDFLRHDGFATQRTVQGPPAGCVATSVGGVSFSDVGVPVILQAFAGMVFVPHDAMGFLVAHPDLARVRVGHDDGGGNLGEHGLHKCILGLEFPQQFQILFLVPLPGGDVGEQDADLSAVRSAHSVGVHVVPAAHRLRLVHEPLRLARRRYLSVNLEPVGVVVGDQLPDRPAHGVLEAGVLLEGRVRLQKAVVGGPVVGVVQHFDDAERLVHRLEQSTEPLLTLPQRLAGLPPQQGHL